jgi:hypothetical protein
MRHPLPHTVLAACALLAVAAPGAAQAKRKPRSLQQATYEVVVRAAMDEEWYFDELSSSPCLPGDCTRETKGQGKAKISLKAKPVQWLVMRGAGGRPPQINVGTGEGAPATGPYQRSAELVTHYEGQWAAANPDVVSDTADCGTRSMTVDFNVFFRSRNVLAPSAPTDTLRDHCVDGPVSGLEWDAGGSPSLGDAITQTSQTRFLRTKAFTVRGSHTWHADVNPPTGSYVRRTGYKNVTWRWEATFRMLRGEASPRGLVSLRVLAQGLVPAVP